MHLQKIKSAFGHRIATVGQLALAAAALLSLAPRAAQADPVTISGPIAEPLEGDGTGLCAASAISTAPANDFPMSAAAYNTGMNTFMEDHAKDRVEATLRTLFDLSNNNASGPQGSTPKSYGDFLDANLPACKTGGCDFAWNDQDTSFASRFRGYLNVTADMAGKEHHIGFFADDAVSLTFFGKNGAIYPVIKRPPQLGVASWRVTNTVTFTEAGLYPVEILYASIVEHSALEMALFGGAFTDVEQPQTMPGAVKLSDAGFTLFAPTSFFQSLSGVLPYADPAQCKQCDRQFVNLPGNNGCDAGYYCNEAAVCAQCDSALLCGPSCSPCGGDVPFCVEVSGQFQCGGCRTDYDCKEGSSCNPLTHTCSASCEGSGGCSGEGGGGGAGVGGSGGSPAPDPGEGEGCSCRLAGDSPRSMSALGAHIALAAALWARRRRSGARSSKRA